LGSSVDVCEALKNLVLPGIGYFDIVDNTVVTERDLGKNFFITSPNDVGKNRGEIVAKNLALLNPTCIGNSYYSIDKVDVDQYTVVIISRNFQDEKLHAFLKSVRYLVHLESIGFLGRMRIRLNKAHVVLEPKSEEGRIDDLRIVRPWEELKNFSGKIFESPLSDMDMCHIPWLVLLIQSIESLDSEILTSSCIIEALKKLGGHNFASGLNFKEAVDNVFRVTALCADKTVVAELEEQIQQYKDSEGQLGEVMKVICGIVKFFHKHNTLPLCGSSLPDMTSYTETYTELMKLYREKWEGDLREVKKLIGQDVDEYLLTSLVANIRNIYILPPGDGNGTPQVDEESQLDFIRALDGEYDAIVDARLKQEISRYQNACELHAVSSVIGSVAAQEIVKLITNQFVPVDDTFVFNGITGEAFTYRSV